MANQCERKKSMKKAESETLLQRKYKAIKAKTAAVMAAAGMQLACGESCVSAGEMSQAINGNVAQRQWLMTKWLVNG